MVLRTKIKTTNVYIIVVPEAEVLQFNFIKLDYIYYNSTLSHIFEKVDNSPNLPKQRNKYKTTN